MLAAGEKSACELDVPLAATLDDVRELIRAHYAYTFSASEIEFYSDDHDESLEDLSTDEIQDAYIFERSPIQSLVEVFIHEHFTSSSYTHIVADTRMRTLKATVPVDQAALVAFNEPETVHQAISAPQASNAPNNLGTYVLLNHELRLLSRSIRWIITFYGIDVHNFGSPNGEKERDGLEFGSTDVFDLVHPIVTFLVGKFPDAVVALNQRRMGIALRASAILTL